MPIDALPWQAFAANAQPCLEVRFGEPESIGVRGEKRWRMSCTVTNVGAGAARATRLFLPYLDVIDIDTMQPGQDYNGGFFIDDRFAFWYFVKFPAQAVFEYEDISGFLYRQYGTVDQGPTLGGAVFRFSIRAIGKPYRVKARIVKPELPAAWLCEIPK